MAVKFNKIMVLTALAVLLLILPACSRDKKEQTTEKPDVAATEKAELAKEVVTSIKGKILEVARAGSGNFIFILLDRGEQQIWATVPAVDVKVGEEVTLLNANVFKNFHSQSMNRSFDELIFSTGIAGKSSGRRIPSTSPKKQAGRMAADVAETSSPTK